VDKHVVAFYLHMDGINAFPYKAGGAVLPVNALSALIRIDRT